MGWTSKLDSRLGLAAIAVLLVAAIASSGALAGFIGGTKGPDEINGTSGRDRISGFGGDDFLRGRGDRDRVRGGKGDDEIRGGGERDKLRGGKGDDRLRGGGGTDKLFGGPGRDGFNTVDGVLMGSPGNDVIRARDGTPDEIDCAEGYDKAFVDEVEDGVYNCEAVIAPDGEIGEHRPPREDG